MNTAWVKANAGIIGILAAVAAGGFILFKRIGQVDTVKADGTTPTTNVNQLALGSEKFNLAQPQQTNAFSASLLMLSNGAYSNGVPLLPTSPDGYTAADALYGTGPGSITEYLSNGFAAVTNAAGVTTLVPTVGAVTR